MSYKRDVKVTCPTYASTSAQSRQTQHLVDNSKSNPKVQTKLKIAFLQILCFAFQSTAASHSQFSKMGERIMRLLSVRFSVMNSFLGLL